MLLIKEEHGQGGFMEEVMSELGHEGEEDTSRQVPRIYLQR